jgi:CubicO group peptidase (beta-lactamase class C family)
MPYMTTSRALTPEPTGIPDGGPQARLRGATDWHEDRSKGDLDERRCEAALDPLSALPDTPAAWRLAEITSLTREATPTGVIEYVQANFTPEYAQHVPIARRIGAFMDWKARGGMDVVEVALSEPHRIEAVVRQPLTDELRVLGVQVEAEPPHRIDGLMLGRAPLPAIQPPLDERAAADGFIDYTEHLADIGRFSGAVLIARNGRILAQKAWGLANRDFDVPNNLETRFNVGSIGKAWTAVALAQLVEAGKLSFQDPLSKYVDYPDAASAARIRIEHLLSHTSGLGCYFNDVYDRTARKHIRTVDDYLALSKDQPLAFEPGTDWRYSNAGFIVLGKVIEVVTGRTYFDHVQATVLAPAGMDRSGLLELDRVNKNLAVGYSERWSVDGVEVLNNLFDHIVRGGPAGGGFATVGDLFRFTEALKDGKLVSTSMVEVLTTAKPELGSPLYGFGFGIHPSRVMYGHSGGYFGLSSNLDIVEDPAGWVVVVLANDMGMRAPTLKARQLIGVTVPEPTSTRACLPTAYQRRR